MSRFITQQFRGEWHVIDTQDAGICCVAAGEEMATYILSLLEDACGSSSAPLVSLEPQKRRFPGESKESA